MLRRQFWLTFIVFAVVTGMAYALSRYGLGFARVIYQRNQAVFLSEIILATPGDPIAYAKTLQSRADQLDVPFDVDVLTDGISQTTGKPDDPTHRSGERVMRPLPGGPGVRQLVVTVRPPPTVRISVMLTFTALMIALVIASFLSVFLLYTHMREKAEVAKIILRRMQQGDLKARFPTSRLDEFGQVLVLFNDMAAEIERLVDQLKQKERARMQLLQELAHDLRTPVSSLRNLVETLRFGEAELKPGAREELMDLAYQETEYLTRLVEDLLFLALVLEPKYKEESDTVDIRELLNSVMTTVARGYPNVVADFPEGPPAWVTGNALQLRRLLRNALDNAFSFARASVNVRLIDHGPEVRVVVSDDGPGFSEESLNNFGRKRATRYHPTNNKDRLSVGLGSVIMSTIVGGHGGTLRVENRRRGEQIVGSEVTIGLLQPFLNLKTNV